MDTPTVGRIIHCRTKDTPPATCRAALVIEVSDDGRAFRVRVFEPTAPRTAVGAADFELEFSVDDLDWHWPERK